MEEVAGPLAHIPPHIRRPARLQRALRIVLGLLWILDAALQFQPFMFTKSFVDANIVANATGQPTVVSWIITHVGHFLLPHIAVWGFSSGARPARHWRSPSPGSSAYGSSAKAWA
jgi:hypothetical protein